ncbi:MAG: hypothetical protein KatS3mg060_1830 [Dehalococcoidia bacterium]|jgi:hypothetical protein|nr:MAG: hypothetical protein KatS3mg060_1830 [Dehalococcoidia bacterium]
MTALELALDLAADVATMVVLPARGGLARVASRTVDVALDLADRLRAGHDARARDALISLENGVAVLRRLEALADRDAERLLARCAEIDRLLGGRRPFSPLAFDRQTDCSPAFLEEDDA